MENMDKGLTACTKNSADSLVENTPNASKMSAQKFQIFEKKLSLGVCSPCGKVSKKR